MSIIKVKNLTKYFGDTKAIDGISFEVKKGEILGFLGPNGAGKTTTIRCILDFLKKDSGIIKVLGKDTSDSITEIKKQVGFLSGEVNLYNQWTGKTHIKYLEKLKRADSKDSKDIISRLKLDINKKVKNLSSGNKQKLGIVLSLIGSPKVLILDEPTNALDPLLQIEVYRILKEKAKAGTTIFMSSHILSDVEKVCDRVCIIKSGQIVAIEKVKTLKQKKIYQVTVSFEHKVAKKDIASDEIEVAKQIGNTFTLKVKGNISKLINKISEHKIKDIEIAQSSLEEVFLEYYK